MLCGNERLKIQPRFEEKKASSIYLFYKREVAVGIPIATIPQVAIATSYRYTPYVRSYI